ncbi:MAG: secretory protein [Pedobacter sp.]|nr:MAG: secretory protein [Pedobacter sp.]
MSKTCTLLFLTALCLFCSVHLNAQNKETFKEHGLTLNFTSLEPSFDPVLKKRMVETFFKVYPLLIKEYNDTAAREVDFVIDTAYKGVAATAGGLIMYSPVYFKDNPGDIDVVTHEAMHVIQNYGHRSGPGWLTEGIADYVRYKFGVDNPGAGWALPEYENRHKYTDSYRVTARFLAWAENHGKKGLVKKLDASMRGRTYTKAIWQNETGKTLDELWKAYSENPAL